MCAGVAGSKTLFGGRTDFSRLLSTDLLAALFNSGCSSLSYRRAGDARRRYVTSGICFTKAFANILLAKLFATDVALSTDCSMTFLGSRGKDSFVGCY